MKYIKIVPSIIILLLAFSLNAQHIENQDVPKDKNVMNATSTHTFAYMVEGVERPYKVTVRKKRKSEGMAKSDVDQMSQGEKINTENVAVLLTITNEFNSSDDRVISLRYDKSINDTFELESTENGFLIHVNEKTMKYTIGKGISYTSPSDIYYFKVNEFDVMQ